MKKAKTYGLTHQKDDFLQVTTPVQMPRIKVHTLLQSAVPNPSSASCCAVN